jgi:hypothetical protein
MRKLIACAGLMAALTACNNEQALNTGGATDWVDATPTTPTTRSTPTPSASATPAPTPTATASPTPVAGLYTGPAEMEKYVQKFVDDAKAQGLDVLPKMKNPQLSIQIASLDSYGSSVIGLCETSGSMRRVTFDPDFWNSVSETQRELVAHHELGHCILYRAHRNDTLSTGAYASIMYPVIMASSTYTSNYAYYQNELFTYGVSGLSSGDPAAEENSSKTHVCDFNEALGAM